MILILTRAFALFFFLGACLCNLIALRLDLGLLLMLVSMLILRKLD